MTIKHTFVPPEYWYIKKDTTHNKWEFFEKWFRDKGHIRDDYNGHWEYFTCDMDGYNILPNVPKGVKCITIEQWKMWYSSDVEQEKIQPLGIDIGEEGGDAIPQENIELPAFNWDWVMKQLEENQKLNLIPFTALAVMATHIGAMDKLIQANNK